eukprot:snap_masked-scaffold317_size209118-processed-gene-1.9 protein:Tk01603 transcript:snap_masked-scaffold317_size209118-processed-gene-1.9-mRNA-1 annotation:"---NA---"
MMKLILLLSLCAFAASNPNEERLKPTQAYFNYYTDDCMREFCPTLRHKCCCEGAMSGGKQCCEMMNQAYRSQPITDESVRINAYKGILLSTLDIESSEIERYITMKLLIVITLCIVALAQGKEVAQNRQPMGYGYFNDCQREFCPVMKQECCCENAVSGGPQCCEVKTDWPKCCLYVCQDGYWQCKMDCKDK